MLPVTSPWLFYWAVVRRDLLNRLLVVSNADIPEFTQLQLTLRNPPVRRSLVDTAVGFEWLAAPFTGLRSTPLSTLIARHHNAHPRTVGVDVMLYRWFAHVFFIWFRGLYTSFSRDLVSLLPVLLLPPRVKPRRRGGAVGMTWTQLDWCRAGPASLLADLVPLRVTVTLQNYTWSAAYITAGELRWVQRALPLS